MFYTLGLLMSKKDRKEEELWFVLSFRHHFKYKWLVAFTPLTVYSHWFAGLLYSQSIVNTVSGTARTSSEHTYQKVLKYYF